MENDIYKLNLNESVSTGNLVILRVPGGWIYTQTLTPEDFRINAGTESVSITPVFVPFNNEFQIIRG